MQTINLAEADVEAEAHEIWDDYETAQIDADLEDFDEDDFYNGLW